MLLECSVDLLGQSLHLLCWELEFGFAEIHVAFLTDGDEVDVSMRHFESDDRHSDLGAGHNTAERCGHMLGENVHLGQCGVVEVEDVVHFLAGDDKGVSFGEGIDVEEGIELFAFGALVGRDFSCSDFTKNRHKIRF